MTAAALPARAAAAARRPSTWTVYKWELLKLRAQKRTYLGLGAAVLVPCIFIVALMVETGGPDRVPFGRYVRETGLAIPLVLLLFGSIWLFPLIVSLVAGDIVAAEDRNGTMKTILTRSVERHQLFVAKVAAAFTYAFAALLLFAGVAAVFGGLRFGFNPLTTLSGNTVGVGHGLVLTAGALIRDPALLILDEPTTGLDPAGMRDMRHLVRRLAEQGITVLLSSHIMAEVEELCDRLAIVRSGRVIYEGRLDELLHSTGQRYRLRTTDDHRALEIATHQPGVGEVRFEDEGLSLAADEDAAAGLSIALVEAGLGIRALVPAAASLEELFFRLTEGDTNGANGAAPRKEVAV